MLTTRKKDFIEFMMSADVLRFGEFQTKSGRLTPYFINTGNYKTGGQIAALGRFYAALIHETCGDNEGTENHALLQRRFYVRGLPAQPGNFSGV